MSASKVTTDHEKIRAWCEERGGKPATVRSTHGKSDVGVLRIDFPGGAGEETLEPISWDQFFEKFDEKNLAFLYQDEVASGKTSRFFKLVNRDNEKLH